MLKVNATEFKARCLALLDQVARTGEELVITKRGRPVAQVVPVHRKRTQHPFEALRGTVETVGDIVGPALAADAWDAERGDWEP